MHRTLRRELLIAGLLLAGLVGCLPPDEPVRPKPTIDPDIAQLSHAWKVSSHVLSTKTNLSERDASDMHGRAITTSSASYTTPWHGTCEEANREKRKRELVEITSELDLSTAGHTAVRDFGLGDPVLEFRFSCAGKKTRVPALTIFVGRGRAMTCFGGACYLLK